MKINYQSNKMVPGILSMEKQKGEKNLKKLEYRKLSEERTT